MFFLCPLLESSSESECESDEDSTCSSSSDSEVFDVIAEIKRKKAHPDRLHDELWYNDPGQVCMFFMLLLCRLHTHTSVTFMTPGSGCMLAGIETEFSSQGWVLFLRVHFLSALEFSSKAEAPQQLFPKSCVREPNNGAGS